MARTDADAVSRRHPRRQRAPSGCGRCSAHWPTQNVIVVANGATAEVHAVLADFPAVEVVRLEPNRGPAGARNAGWQAAVV